MKKRLGAITIGQSPRFDVIPEMVSILGEDIEVLQAGALDGLAREEIESFVPADNDIVLVSKLSDGGWVKFGESHILPRLQECIYRLEEKKADIIVFICTGKFPAQFKSSRLLIYPQTILHSIVSKLTTHGKIGVVNPDRDQINQCIEIWNKSVNRVEAVAGSPYGDILDVINAAYELKDKDVDLIVLDCIGYTIKMKEIVGEITGKPVILPRTLVARVIKELL